MLVKCSNKETSVGEGNVKNCNCSTGDMFTPSYPPMDFINDIGMSSSEAYEIVNSESYFDSDTKLNMATFVTTWMEQTAVKVVEQNLDKNFIDKLIYPQTVEMERRCISILANLLNAGDKDEPVGTSTIGSTEAAMLAGLNYKFLWKKWVGEKGIERPEIIFGTNVQVCWEKFVKYFEVTPIRIPIGPDLKLDIDEVAKKISCRTICVVGIFGDTFTGRFDDIEALNDVVDKYNKNHEWKVPIHVDAASGGFVAPFYQRYKDILWDFRLKWVKSINISGHKYGHVFAGIGWSVWRNDVEIDKELVFKIDYLGGSQEDFSLNFTKNASNIVVQYYNLVRLGREGYEQILDYLFGIKYDLISRFNRLRISNIKIFDIIDDPQTIPIVVLSLTNKARKMGLNLSKLAWEMKKYEWDIPAYSLPEPYGEKIVIRLVLRLGFNIGMANKLYEDMLKAIKAVLEIESDESISLSSGSNGIC